MTTTIGNGPRPNATELADINARTSAADDAFYALFQKYQFDTTTPRAQIWAELKQVAQEHLTMSSYDVPEGAIGIGYSGPLVSWEFRGQYTIIDTRALVSKVSLMARKARLVVPGCALHVAQREALARMQAI